MAISTAIKLSDLRLLLFLQMLGTEYLMSNNAKTLHKTVARMRTHYPLNWKRLAPAVLVSVLGGLSVLFSCTLVKLAD